MNYLHQMNVASRRSNKARQKSGKFEEPRILKGWDKMSCDEPLYRCFPLLELINSFFLLGRVLGPFGLCQLVCLVPLRFALRFVCCFPCYSFLLLFRGSAVWNKNYYYFSNFSSKIIYQLAVSWLVIYIYKRRIPQTVKILINPKNTLD